MAQQGVENPYDKFPGWLASYMRARCKLTESGTIDYFSPSAEQVAQRALRDSSQGSNEGEREHDTLTRALGNVEQRGRVRGVSSKLTWKEGFPEHKPSYRKWKGGPSSTVDIEEIKRQVRRGLLGDLKPILESQGLHFPDIPEMMSQEEHMGSFASTAAAPINREEAEQAAQSGGREGRDVQATDTVPIMEPSMA